MTAYAKIGIIGKSRSELLEELARIRAWGGDLPVLVSAGAEWEILETPDNLEKAINGDLAGYIEQKFTGRTMIIKASYPVPYPEYTKEGLFRKIRHKATNITPKKKKRKKQRR